MYIHHLGHSTFQIVAKANNEDVNIVTDPYGKELGLRMTKVDGDVVTISHDHHDHNELELIKTAKPFIVTTAGEYEYKGVVVTGVQTYHDDALGKERGINVAYKITVENLSILHLGDLGHVLTDSQLEKIKSPDILMIPVGGKYTIDAKKAAEVVRQLEPRIIIPMHYKTDKVKIDIDTVEPFLKEMGVSGAEKVDKLRVVKKDLIEEEQKVVVFAE